MKGKVLVKRLALIAVLFLLSVSNALAQTGPCVGDLNCDGEVSGLDTIIYKADFPRSEYLGEPCPEINPRCSGQACEGTLSALGRWCDQGDGTVKDITTGLVWLKNAGWGGGKAWGDCTTHDDAHTRAGLLDESTSGAGLSDGSVEGDWRLPTKTELYNLANGTEAVRSGSMQLFTGVQSGAYWSSTTSANYNYDAWYVDMDDGTVCPVRKYYSYYVFPVRGGND